MLHKHPVFSKASQQRNLRRETSETEFRMLPVRRSMVLLPSTRLSFQNSQDDYLGGTSL